jgi:hypothetical protein
MATLGAISGIASVGIALIVSANNRRVNGWRSSVRFSVGYRVLSVSWPRGPGGLISEYPE